MMDWLFAMAIIMNRDILNIQVIFAGEYIHSHDFKSAKPFTDKKVLVIGGGNSACDVAVETARVSKETHISWRRAIT